MPNTIPKGLIQYGVQNCNVTSTMLSCQTTAYEKRLMLFWAQATGTIYKYVKLLKKGLGAEMRSNNQQRI